MASSLTEYVI
ncbi:hypothetical protein PENPOL_c002G00314 [Penicillium polonicum]|uniref:Uncharacterized protein n=1 Tax=Penicillium polonicum TaxID=60169 RepID=A0A1V6NWR5_PENPO|nr:hypothetical protein PENPOL_c002G00314 [Penicillium polonicum]